MKSHKQIAHVFLGDLFTANCLIQQHVQCGRVSVTVHTKGVGQTDDLRRRRHDLYCSGHGPDRLCRMQWEAVQASRLLPERLDDRPVLLARQGGAYVACRPHAPSYIPHPA